MKSEDDGEEITHLPELPEREPGEQREAARGVRSLSPPVVGGLIITSSVFLPACMTLHTSALQPCRHRHPPMHRAIARSLIQPRRRLLIQTVIIKDPAQLLFASFSGRPLSLYNEETTAPSVRPNSQRIVSPSMCKYPGVKRQSVISGEMWLRLSREAVKL